MVDVDPAFPSAGSGAPLVFSAGGGSQGIAGAKFKEGVAGKSQVQIKTKGKGPS
jgi:hypothetical protein